MNRREEQIFGAIRAFTAATISEAEAATQVIERIVLGSLPYPSATDAAHPKAHAGDPCFYCDTPHDDVAPGPCAGRSQHPWGHPKHLGRLHRMLGQPGTSGLFHGNDRATYLRAFHGDNNDALPDTDATKEKPDGE